MTWSKEEFLNLMQYPREWILWDLYPPDGFLHGQIRCYEPGDENASEHFRYGAFLWWLKNEPTKEQLEKLLKLADLDPDPPMAASAKEKILARLKFEDAETHQNG